jgi:hypothetical protein
LADDFMREMAGETTQTGTNDDPTRDDPICSFDNQTETPGARDDQDQGQDSQTGRGGWNMPAETHSFLCGTRSGKDYLSPSSQEMTTTTLDAATEMTTIATARSSPSRRRSHAAAVTTDHVSKRNDRSGCPPSPKTLFHSTDNASTGTTTTTMDLEGEQPRSTRKRRKQTAEEMQRQAGLANEVPERFERAPALGRRKDEESAAVAGNDARPFTQSDDSRHANENHQSLSMETPSQVRGAEHSTRVASEPPSQQNEHHEDHRQQNQQATTKPASVSVTTALQDMYTKLLKDVLVGAVPRLEWATKLIKTNLCQMVSPALSNGEAETGPNDTVGSTGAQENVDKLQELFERQKEIVHRQEQSLDRIEKAQALVKESADRYKFLEEQGVKKVIEDLKTTREENTQLRQALSEAKSEIKKLQHELATKSSELKKRESELKAANREKDSLKKEFTKGIAEQFQAIERHVEKTKQLKDENKELRKIASRLGLKATGTAETKTRAVDTPRIGGLRTEENRKSRREHLLLQQGTTGVAENKKNARDLSPGGMRTRGSDVNVSTLEKDTKPPGIRTSPRNSRTESSNHDERSKDTSASSSDTASPLKVDEELASFQLHYPSRSIRKSSRKGGRSKNSKAPIEIESPSSESDQEEPFFL